MNSSEKPGGHFHSGGPLKGPGLREDEIPAILSRGMSLPIDDERILGRTHSEGMNVIQRMIRERDANEGREPTSGDAYAQALADRHLPKTAAQQLAARVPMPDIATLVSYASPATQEALTESVRAYGLACVREAMRSCAVAFADTDPEARFIEDSAHLNCPVCGGSGHVDDAMRGGVAVAEVFACENGPHGKVLDIPMGMVRFLEVHPVGTKLYTSPPAGSVEVTDAMVERLARHLIREAHPRLEESFIDYAMQGRISREYWLKKASAALTAALQEPTND